MNRADKQKSLASQQQSEVSPYASAETPCSVRSSGGPRPMIPEAHPLQQLFQDLVGRHYAEEIGIRDPQIIAYVSHLLAEFCEADQVFKIRTANQRPLSDVGEML